MSKVRNWSWKRFFIRTSLIILGIVILLIIIASPLAKYLVHKYDVEYTGREITVGRVFLNPVAGSVALRNLQVFEEAGDSIFFSAGKLSANVTILKLITGVYDVSSVRVNDPVIKIIRDDTLFNFSDLIAKFTVPEDTIPEEEVKFNVRNIEINNGIVNYSEKQFPFEIRLYEIYFNSPGMFWDVDSINGEFSLIPGEGELNGDFMFNQENMHYRLAMNLSDFGIGQFEPYLVEMTGKANISAIINLDVSARGNVDSLMKGRATGSFELNDLHFGTDPENDFFSMNRFLVQFREINLRENRFYFDSILIDKPEILYQMYDTLDNFRRMFSSTLAEEEEKEVDETADTVDFLVELIGTDYYIRSFAVTDGKFEFNDYSIAEKFSMSINPLDIKADTIDKENQRVKVLFNGNLQPYGKFAATLSMNPENVDYFDFNYEFRNVAATMFNPYILTYSSYQLDHGTIEMHGDWSVRNGKINALNHFLVINPQNTKRVRGKDTDWVPLPLILSFIRERGSVIDYQIPIKGDLNDPEFKIADIISDLLRNILVKPPTTPYRLEVRNVENKIEKNMIVTWKMRQHDIAEGQERFMKNIADFLKDNPEANIVVQPIFHEEKERENILLFEAKKKYFFLSQKKEVSPLSKDDSLKVEKLSSKDKAFVSFLDNTIKNSELLTLQEKCYRFIGRDVVEKKYTELIKKRQEAFLKYFRDEGTEKKVEIMKVKTMVPYNWFSHYDIKYKGDVPESLSKAFDKLYEINSEPPRREFFDPPRR